MRLGEILVRIGKVTPEQVAEAARKQGEVSPSKPVVELLAETGNVEEDVILEALGEEFGCDVLGSVDDAALDPALVDDLPVEWARGNCVLPISWKGGIAAVTCDPSAVSVLEYLSLMLKADVVPVLAPPAEIRKAIERCYFQRQDSARELIEDMAGAADAKSAQIVATDDLLRVADQAPVTQLVNVILLEAVKARASDVHVEPFERSLRVRYRIDGMLYEQASPPKHLEAALVSRLKVMAKLDIAEKRLPQDGTARVRVGEREIDIRVSTIPVAEGERVVLRLLNREASLIPLTRLGMDEELVTQFKGIIREPNGVVLVTGPTGSGKTTTLYAALGEIDTARMNVLTIEDPIEYQIPRVGQMQVKPKIGLTFAQGLRHILRQDPDVILVGETRDLETAEIVVRASLTGHLVFSTLHTNDATSAGIRMIDMGIAPYLLSSALKGSLAQRLVRSLCPQCRKEAVLGDDECAALGGKEKLKGGKHWKAQGCQHCVEGYSGRVGVFEFMAATPEIREAIRTGAGAREVRALAESRGMRTLADDARAKVLAGHTSVAEVQRVVGRSDSPSYE